MKKLSFIAVILLVSVLEAGAQQTNTKVHQKADPSVPMAVLAAIDAHNPGLTFQQQHLMEHATASKKEKKSSKNKRVNTPPTQLYQVLSRGRQYKKKEVYNQYGDLIYSKESIRNTALPLAVRQYIGREYNGWLVKRDLAVKTISGNGSESVYYKILLQNGKEKERITLNEQGLIYVRK